MPEWVTQPHPHMEYSLITFPRKHVVLVTINRPQAMNCLPFEATVELVAFWKWYDTDPGLRCAVITGSGQKAFCAGMDLKQRLDVINSNETTQDYPHDGFGGMSNRRGKKPVVVACNGHAHGTFSIPKSGHASY